MNVYYAGPAHLAGPAMGPGRAQENLARTHTFNPRLTAETLMWSSARYHLLQGATVLFCSPRRVIAAVGSHPFGLVASALGDLASEVFEFMQAATRPSNRMPSALFINDLGLLLGAEDGARSLACSLEAYIRYAPAAGSACYLSCEDPETLSGGLRRALASHATSVRFGRVPKATPDDDLVSGFSTDASHIPIGSRRSA